VGEQRPVVLGELGKAQAGVHDDVARIHTRRDHRLQPAAKLGPNFGHHVAVDSRAVHVSAVAAPVHHDVGNAGLGDHADHVWIGLATADVVHHPGPGRQRAARDLGTHRVDAHETTGFRERRDHGHDPV
jgi:hypothetical protein